MLTTCFVVNAYWLSNNDTFVRYRCSIYGQIFHRYFDSKNKMIHFNYVTASFSLEICNQYLTFSAKTWPRNGLSNVTHFMVSRYPVTLCRCKGRLGYRNVFFVGFWSLCHFYYSSSRQADSSRQAFKTSGWNVCTERRRRRRRRTEEDCRRK